MPEREELVCREGGFLAVRISIKGTRAADERDVCEESTVPVRLQTGRPLVQVGCKAAAQCMGQM